LEDQDRWQYFHEAPIFTIIFFSNWNRLPNPDSIHYSLTLQVSRLESLPVLYHVSLISMLLWKWNMLFSVTTADCWLYKPEYVVLFRMTVSIYYRNLIKTVRAVSKKTAILYFGAHMKGRYFWRQNIHIHRTTSCDG
jgi:hypothetical protein